MNKVFIKSTQIVFGACALMVIAGCSSTPRGLQHVPSQPAVVVDPSQTEADQSFASSAARLEVGGSASVIQTTPIGPAQRSQLRRTRMRLVKTVSASSCGA